MRVLVWMGRLEMQKMRPHFDTLFRSAEGICHGWRRSHTRENRMNHRDFDRFARAGGGEDSDGRGGGRRL